MQIKRIYWYIVYQRYIMIKKGTEQTHEVFTRYILDILMRTAYNWNIPCIYHVYTINILVRLWYTSYIPRLFIVYTTWFILSKYFVYAKYIYCISSVYTMYILGKYIVYFWVSKCIYLVYTLFIHGIICVYTPPGGWCCGGGQGPIPPAPPAITSKSPGRVITFILLEQGIKCHTGNIPGIYQVYWRYIPNVSPWTSCWIRLQGWSWGDHITMKVNVISFL